MKKQCQEKGCNETQNLVKCRLVMTIEDVSPLWYLREYGWREALRIWKELYKVGAADVYDHYCAEHCQKNGYCYSCGEFWAGSESFDFSRSGLCSNCRSEYEEDYDEDEDDDYPYGDILHYHDP